MLIVHEVMGRNCGWLTAATAPAYRAWVTRRRRSPGFGHDQRRWDVHAVFVPEMALDIAGGGGPAEGGDGRDGLRQHLPVRGRGRDAIVAEMTGRGDETRARRVRPRQARHDQPRRLVRQAVRARCWRPRRPWSRRAATSAASAAANADDLRLIKSCTDLAVECALRGEGGVIGHDEDRGGRLRAIEFERIKGGKPFDVEAAWFTDLLASIGQPKGAPVAAPH